MAKLLSKDSFTDDSEDSRVFYYQSPDSSYMVKWFKHPQHLKRERQTLEMVGGHPHMLKHYEDLSGESEIAVEPFSKNLREVILHREIDDQFILEVMTDLAEALAFMHSKSVLHRDIRPESVFLTANNTFKLGNFEVSTTIEELESLYGIELSEDVEGSTSRGYRAPELIDFSPGFQISTQIDMWALGCLLYELICGNLPFQDREDRILGKFKPPVDKFWARVLKLLLATNPRERTTAQQLLYILREEKPSTSITPKSCKILLKQLCQNNAYSPDKESQNMLIEKLKNYPEKLTKVFKLINEDKSSKILRHIKSLMVIHRIFIAIPRSVHNPTASRIITKLEICSTNDGMDEDFRRVLNKYADVLSKKLRCHKNSNSTGNWNDYIVNFSSILRDLTAYWEDLQSLCDILKETNNCHELMNRIIALAIEEQQNLSEMIQSELSSMSPTLELNNISLTCHKTQTNLNAFIDEFRLKNPHIQLPISEDKTQDITEILKERRAMHGTELNFELNPCEKAVSGQPTWILNENELVKQDIIGSGSTSHVFRGLYKSTPVAIKLIKAEFGMLEDFERELNMYAILRHPNISLFIGASYSPEQLIVTELCKGHNLFTLLHQSKHIKISWTQRVKMAKDVAQAMLYIHTFDPPIMHRDLKSLNILLTEPITGVSDRVTLKITDFGLAKVVNPFMTGNIGTQRWMAPEVITSSPYSFAADVYSFGIVLWEILTRHLPYGKCDDKQIRKMVLRGEMPDMDLIPATCHPKLKSLVCKCLRQEPELRPDFYEINKILETIMSSKT